jgi:hypothetical protein
MHDFWPASGNRHLECLDRGWLRPTDEWWRALLARPELALVSESCSAEIALHAALRDVPTQPVAPGALAAVRDADARENLGHFLAFREALLQAGSLEACYLTLMRSGRVRLPPAFVDLLVQAILRQVLADSADAFEVRAAELLFRPQRITRRDGRLLAADRDRVDLLRDTAGLGDIGRLLVQQQASMPALELQVLTPENAEHYWREGERRCFALDLTHEVASPVGPGLSLTLNRKHSGLKALSRVLERWTAHLLGVQVLITPLQRIDDPAWRWHLGLDAQAMALLNDLYEDRPVEPERLARLVSLFRLDFVTAAQMRSDVAGKPVYLGLATDAEQVLRVKPQNLLLNLPLAAVM